MPDSLTPDPPTRLDVRWMLTLGADTYRGELATPHGYQAKVTRNAELLTAITFAQRDAADAQLIMAPYLLDPTAVG